MFNVTFMESIDFKSLNPAVTRANISTCDTLVGSVISLVFMRFREYIHFKDDIFASIISFKLGPRKSCTLNP